MAEWDETTDRVDDKVINWAGKKCYYCQSPAHGIDHIVPRVKGGTDDESNLVPCCMICNSEKCGRSFWEWFRDTLQDRRVYKRRLEQIKHITTASIVQERQENISP